MAEAMMALVLVDAWLRHRARDGALDAGPAEG
jgi:chorismate synthase